MIIPEEIRKGLWTFPIVLPNNPLKWLNCYVIKGENGGRNLLIDTGFNQPECIAALDEGMTALGILPENTDVFLTHFHSDHAGNAAYLQSKGSRIIMGATDFAMELRHRKGGDAFNYRTVTEGMPEDIYTLIDQCNPAKKFKSPPYDAETAQDGDVLRYGGYTLRCLSMAGHTPGHMCLYEQKKKIMFLGDHVLFDITPNITCWPNVKDSLGDYMANLRRMKEFEVELPLPAHRQQGSISLNERIDALLRHHEFRLEETRRIVCESSGIYAYEVAGKMTWKIRARNWDDFPLSQKIFAYGETLAHLDYLVERGLIRRDDSVYPVAYYPPES